MKPTLALLPLLTLLGCWSPLYNQDVSLAAALTAKMDLDAQFTLTEFDSSKPLYALADPYREPMNILICQPGPSSIQLNFWLKTPTGYYRSASFGQSYPLVGDLDTLQVSVGVNGGSPVYAVSLPTTTNGGSPGTNPGSIFCFSSNNGSINSVPGTGQSFLGFVQSAGIQNLLTASNGFVSLWWTSVPTAPSTVGGGGSDFTFTTPQPGILAANNNHLDGASILAPVYYLSQRLSADQWKITRFIYGQTAATNWTTGAKLITYLNSTNNLLMQKDGYFLVCDGSGKELYSFPGGSLHFSSEYQDMIDPSVPWRIAFTQILPSSEKDGGNKATVRVYSILAKNLESFK